MPPPDQEARTAYEALSIDSRQAMGGCLLALPPSEEIQGFLVQAKQTWLTGWLNVPMRYPHLLLRLYHCVAFLRYEGNKFWDSFAEAVGEQRISTSRQTEINHAFAHIAGHFGLPLLERAHRLYVQSAVRQVGIPVRVWRGFISVCERLLFADGEWKQWTDEEWESGIAMWVGGRKNLRDFFVKNRETATRWIDEMFEARRVLAEHSSWTLSDIRQVSLLRPEYFDAVPETALFLRPNDPESLFKDRPRLRLSEQNDHIAITLEAPRVSKEAHLPAMWSIAGKQAAAWTNPVGIPIDASAFVNSLILRLTRNDDELVTHHLRGLAPWALWSVALGAFISPEARELPVGFYMIVSRHPLYVASKAGWLSNDEDELRWNVERELRDGSTCYITRLDPDGRRAILEIEEWHRILFAPRERLELRLFPAPPDRFQLSLSANGVIRLPRWPWFLVKMPKGMLAGSGEDTVALLNREFRLFSGGQSIKGKWLECDDAAGLEDDELYHFKVNDEVPFPPLHRKPNRPTITVGGFNQLNAGMVAVADEDQSRPFPLQLRSERHGIIPFGSDAEVTLGRAIALRPSWLEKLQVRFRDYMPWFLLTATQDHASWEELLIAYEMMNMTSVQSRLNQWCFVVIERAGMMKRRGQCWCDFENRIHFGRHEHGTFCVRFAGLTTVIYAVLTKTEPIERIKAVWERGYPPHLEMRFSLQGGIDRHLRHLCQEQQIRIMKESLWTH